MKIEQSVFQFLRELESNNHRDWFLENKDRFKQVEGHVRDFMKALETRLQRHDSIENSKLFRIYRDVRFSKDKTPYKTQFALSFSRIGPERRGGYYVQIKPGHTMIGAGFWQPEKQDLFRIRKEWEMDAEPLKEILNRTDFRTHWGTLHGDRLKRAPKGFPKEHPDLDLIQLKQYLFIRNFTDQEVLDSNWIEQIDLSFKAIRPFFDLMSHVLTTDLNGESLL